MSAGAFVAESSLRLHALIASTLPETKINSLLVIVTLLAALERAASTSTGDVRSCIGRPTEPTALAFVDLIAAIHRRDRAMSIFGSIMDKIFRHGSGSAQAAPQAAPQPSAPASGGDTATIDTGTIDTASATQAPPAQNVDVGAVLGEMASMKGGGGNYQTSIVDLLKLLDLDSSLAARKELADELGVHAGEDGSAEQNIALHKAVMAKLAENGGVVPDSLRN
jgi:hypothetical protein